MIEAYYYYYYTRLIAKCFLSAFKYVNTTKTCTCMV
jgi:hypothetical protein